MTITPEGLREGRPKCGKCGLPIGESSTCLRFFGSFIAHQEGECIRLLQAAHAAALEELAAVTFTVRKIHEAMKRGEATKDHGLHGNLSCILDHVVSEKMDAAEDRRDHDALAEELAALTIDRDNYAAKYAAMRERAERAEAELARLKAPVEVTGIVAKLQGVSNMIGAMCSEGRPPKISIPANPDRDEDLVICVAMDTAAAALKSLAAQLAEANASAERAKAAWDASHNQAMKNGIAALLAKDELAAREAEIAELRESADGLALELTMIVDRFRGYQGCKFIAANAAIDAYRAGRKP